MDEADRFTATMHRSGDLARALGMARARGIVSVRLPEGDGDLAAALRGHALAASSEDGAHVPGRHMASGSTLAGLLGERLVATSS